jgi:hypothetical protein
MSVAMDELNRVTLDYMFRDRDNVKRMFLCCEDAEDFEYLAKECAARRMDAGELIAEALSDQSAKLNAFRDGRISFAGGNKIMVPFQYKGEL